MAAIVVTLATSFTPNVDWAAHAGGALQVSFYLVYMWVFCLCSGSIQVGLFVIVIQLSRFLLKSNCILVGISHIGCVVGHSAVK